MKRAGAALDSVAGVIQQLAVLLGAGISPGTAWGYLATGESGSTDDPVAAIGSAVASGTPPPIAIRTQTAGLPTGPAWAAVAAAWHVAGDAGAPLAPTLRDFATSLRATAAIERGIETTLSAPRATARMVMALPVVGVLFGTALGFDTIGILFTTIPGAICLGLAAVLLLVAAWWNRRLVRAASPRSVNPGLRADLLAIAVSGGASLDRAMSAVDSAISASFPEGAEDDAAETAAVLELSRRAGVPAAELLRSSADEARRTATAQAERKASVLAVTLMLPLGLCILPAFMVVGVVPLVIAVISSTAAGF